MDIFAVRLCSVVGGRAQALAGVHHCGRSGEEIVAFG